MLIAFAAVTVMTAGAATVRAIVFGLIDSQNSFSNVGAFMVRSPDGPILPVCSGTLIAPGVFLTAAHCAVFYDLELAPRGYTAFVSFDNPIPFGSLTSSNTDLVPVVEVVTNPGYNQAQSDPGDIALLLVSSAETQGITPAALPTAELLSELHAQNGLKGSIFTVAGYGLQDRIVGGGPPFFLDANPVPRMYAFATYNSLNRGYLRMSQNPATGNGGACYGDSGGPNFLNTVSGPVLVAITITGDTPCRSTNVAYRLDIPSARDFLATYVILP